jgi:hypothetical protein
MVDSLVEQFDTYPREVLVNYYTALKTTRFVILASPREADKESLAQGLARALVGYPSLQWSPIRAHPWWTSQTGSPRQMAEAHARFNSLKLRDFIEAASTSEMLGLPFSFFASIKHMSPAEVVCYFEDLPRGRFWNADGSTVPIDLPTNLFITGTLNAEHDEMPILSPEVHHLAMTIWVNPGQCPPGRKQNGRSRAKLDWQQTFITSGTRSGEEARAKLARILPDDCVPLAPLDELARLLGTGRFSSSTCEKAWLYLANAFEEQGRGLFVHAPMENLAIAQDYAMAQIVIPAVRGRWARTPWMEETVTNYLAPRLPRAYARWGTSREVT